MRTVVYIGVSVCYNSTLEGVSVENRIEANKEFSLHSFDHVVFENSLVYILTGWDKQKSIEIYQKALYRLIELNYPQLTERQIIDLVAKALATIERQYEDIRNNSQKWEHGSSCDTFYNMVDVTFPKNSNISTFNFFRESHNRTYSRRINPAFESENRKFNQIAREQISRMPLVNKLSSEYDLRNEIGRKAEAFFYTLLSQLYQDAFKWVSRFKQSVLSRDSFDDSIGYDFDLVQDYKHMFSSSGKPCLIEVKGCGSEWNGTFHLSKNQLDISRSNSDSDYVIVIISNVLSGEIRIAEIINVSENPSVLKLEPDSYLVRYDPMCSVNEETNVSMDEVSTTNDTVSMISDSASVTSE
jgi:hypothetical protein